MANEQKVIEITVKYDDALRGIISLQDSIKQLTEAQKANQRQTQSEKDAFAANTVQLKEYRSQLTALIKEVGNNAKTELKQLGYIQQLKVDVSQLTAQYERLTKAELESAKGGEVLKALQDKRSALSAANEAYGNFSLNVGNYSSATKGLNMSLSQIMSELPNMANGMRIFTMSISNNLPMVVQNIQALRAENKLFAAEGKPTTSVLKTVASSFFGIAGMANIAMLAFQLLTPTIEKWVDSLFKGKKAADQLASSTSVMHDAMKSGGGVYEDAVKNVQKVESALSMYRKGIISAKEFTDIYNKSLGDTMGKANDAGQAIANFTGKKDAYIEAMKQMAYANALFTASSQDMVKMLEISTKSNSEILGSDADKYKEKIAEWQNSVATLTKAGLTSAETAKKQLSIWVNEYNQAADKARKNEIDKIQKHQTTLEKEAQKRAENAQKIANKSNLTIEEQAQKSGKNIDQLEKDRIQKELDAIDLETKGKLNAIKTRQIAEGESQKAYEEQVLRTTEDGLRRKLEILGLEPNKVEEITAQVLDIHQKYTDNLKKIDSDYLKSKGVNLQQQTEEMSKMLKDMADQTDEDMMQRFDARVDLMQQYMEMTTDFGTMSGELIGNIINGTEDSVRESLKNVIFMMLDELKAYIRMTVLKITATGLASMNPAQMAIALGKVALVEAAFAGVKTVISNSMSSLNSRSSSGKSSSSNSSTATAKKYHTGGDITNDGTANSSGEIGITALVGEKMMNRNAANMFSPILDQMNAAGIGRSSLSGLSFAPQFNYSLFAKATAAAVASLPAPEVSVKEISKVNTRVTTIKEIGSYSSKK